MFNRRSGYDKKAFVLQKSHNEFRKCNNLGSKQPQLNTSSQDVILAVTLAKFLDVRFGAMTIVLFAITVFSIILGELANWATVVKREDNETKLSTWYVSVLFITLIPGMVRGGFFFA